LASASAPATTKQSAQLKPQVVKHKACEICVTSASAHGLAFAKHAPLAAASGAESKRMPTYDKCGLCLVVVGNGAPRVKSDTIEKRPHELASTPA